MKQRNSTLLLKNAGLAALLAVGGTSAQADDHSHGTEFGIGANIELDTDYITNRGGGDDSDADLGGRFKVVVTGTHQISDTVALKAVGEPILRFNGDGTDVEDAWIRLSGERWGIRFGRYEAIDLHSVGTDTILNVIGNAADYRANAARGRLDDSGQIGFNFNPSDSFEFHVDTVWGETDDDDGNPIGDGGTDEDGNPLGGDENAVAGIRPAFQWDIADDWRLTAGLDYREDGDSETKGGGIYLRYANDKIAVKMNAASGEKETNDVTDWENETYNINIEAGSIGVGYLDTSDDDGDSASTLYGSYQFFDLMGNENAVAKLAFSAAEADSADETEFGVRFRIYYEF